MTLRSRITCLVGWACLLSLAAHAANLTGTLYFTTFSGGSNVHSVGYTYAPNTSFTLGSVTNLTPTPGADGILFDPQNGNLVVSGQSTGNLSEEAPTGGPVTSVNVGSAGQSYHLALTQGNTSIWNMPNGGSPFISVVGLPFGTNGTSYSVVGPDTDIRGVIWDPLVGQYFYSTACDGCTGNFGIITFNGTVFATSRIASGLYAHGITFDPFTGDLIVNSANTIQQITPGGVVVGTVTHSGSEFDQAAVDGKGHLFVASNNGDLEFVDYSGSGNIGTASFSNNQFLANSLDDIAPLSGQGAPTPEPGTLAMFGSGVLALAGVLRRKILS